MQYLTLHRRASLFNVHEQSKQSLTMIITNSLNYQEKHYTHEGALAFKNTVESPTPSNRGNRGAWLEWTQEHVLLDENQWGNVLFTNESRFWTISRFETY